MKMKKSDLAYLGDMVKQTVYQQWYFCLGIS